PAPRRPRPTGARCRARGPARRARGRGTPARRRRHPPAAAAARTARRRSAPRTGPPAAWARSWGTRYAARTRARAPATRHTVGLVSIEPVDALRRIAFLLERSRESTYRVRAYRDAAATLLALPEEEVRER